MGTKKILGGLLTVETEDKPAITQEYNIPVTPNVPSPQITAAQPSAEDKGKFTKRFDDLFNARNLPGPDYYEFSKMCDALSAIPETERFKAAFAALTVQGLDKKQLIETANTYINIFNDDKSKFNIAVSESVKGVESLSQKITEKKELIAKLQSEISEHEKEIVESTSKVQTNSAAYNQACDAMINRISRDIELINQTI